MQRTDLIEVHSAQDIGEVSFVRSLLQANQITPFCPDLNAEAFSFWANPFFRRFTVYVAPKDVERARELLSDFRQDQPDEKPRPAMRWLARVLLLLFAVTLFMGVLRR
jgi:hypothetical protein